MIQFFMDSLTMPKFQLEMSEWLRSKWSYYLMFCQFITCSFIVFLPVLPTLRHILQLVAHSWHQPGPPAQRCPWFRTFKGLKNKFEIWINNWLGFVTEIYRYWLSEQTFLSLAHVYLPLSVQFILIPLFGLSLKDTIFWLIYFVPKFICNMQKRFAQRSHFHVDHNWIMPINCKLDALNLTTSKYWDYLKEIHLSSVYLIISLIRDRVLILAASEPQLSSMSSMGTELKTMAVISLKHQERF